MSNLKRTLKRSIFDMAEKFLGIHITPVHFYSPIPSSSEISSEDYLINHPCVGLDFNLDMQLNQLNEVFPKYINEYEPQVNSGLAKVDALVLYSIIRSKKPKLMIEIGSGQSTKIALAALEKNLSEGNDYKFIAIEPYPQPYLKDMTNDKFHLIIKKVQQVEVEVFNDADILFIDSSHVSKIGSDVNYEMLNILPTLKVGALIHWHDIMIPGEYPKTWVEEEKIFWNESYMVHTFMMFNKSFRIIWGAKYFQINHPDKLKEVFPLFSPSDPQQQLSSFWVERVA